MSNTIHLLIDLNEAGLNLEPEDLENYIRRLAIDLKDGLAEDTTLVQSAYVPKGSKSGESGFGLGILQAEVNVKNISKLLGWLKSQVLGSALKLEYGDVKLEYRTPEQLAQQIQALEKISQLTVRVVKSEG